MFYAEAIQLKLERNHAGSPVNGQPFFVSMKVCAAINSVLHVQQSIPPLAHEMGLSKLCDTVQRNNNDGSPINSPADQALAESAVKDLGEKLDEIFIAIARRVRLN